MWTDARVRAAAMLLQQLPPGQPTQSAAAALLRSAIMLPREWRAAHQMVGRQEPITSDELFGNEAPPTAVPEDDPLEGDLPGEGDLSPDEG